ncbi:MAG: ExeA family protein [Deltaproteobacteria bacterium]
MYCTYYGFKQPPFNITSDPEFFYESLSHREALAALLFGIRESKGILLLTGEVGTGKTMLCRTLLEKLDEKVKVSFIMNPYFSEVQLLQAVVEDFGLHLEKKSRLDIVKKLNEFLLEVNAKGGNAVLIIDEAQNLTNRQLEQIRLLSNLETASRKLLQIILVGQPELVEKLGQFSLRQIRQRISVKHDISPLREKEVKSYVETRLKRAGDGKLVFSPGSYKLIYEFSKGIPRLVNLLCDRTLLLGYVRERREFDEDICKESIKELS